MLNGIEQATPEDDCFYVFSLLFPFFSPIDGGHLEGDGATKDRLRRDRTSRRRSKILRNRRHVRRKPIPAGTRRLLRQIMERSGYEVPIGYYNNFHNIHLSYPLVRIFLF